MSGSTTPSQTVGPFFRIGMSALYRADVAGPEASGERVSIAGRVRDGDGAPVNDAVIEIWQADADGRYPGARSPRNRVPGFEGFGRVATDEAGAFRFTTIKPGRVPGPGGALQAPHLVAAVFMRGLLKHLVTRIYFPDEPANAGDPVLQRVPAERRGTLVARRRDGEAGALEWNVVMQGNEETVFFDY